MDRDKLAKLLAMTTSDNDGEALNAVRAANRIVKESGMSWQDVLRQAVVHETNITLHRGAPPPGAYQAAPQQDWGGIAAHLKDKVIIDTMFRGIFAQQRVGYDEFWATMDSIHGHFQKHGSLTAGQYRAVQNSYRRAMMSRRV